MCPKVLLRIAALAVVALAVVAPTPAGASSPFSSQVAGRTAAVISQVLSGWTAPGLVVDGVTYDGRGFRTTGAYACCVAGAATAAATLSLTDTASAAHWRRLAVSTIDALIRRLQNRTGAIAGDDIATMMAGVEIGTVDRELSNRLDRTHRRRWQRALAEAADFLISNGNLSWYTNGNINLGNTELFYLAAAVTGAPRFRSAYESALAFTLSPPARWAGFGLHITRRPTRADGSDGAGYLAEANGYGARPGYDPEYTELQLDVAVRLYVFSRDARILRLANMLLNQLQPRVDAQMALDTSGGTRRPQAGRKIPFTTSAVAVLAMLNRPGLRREATAQLSWIEQYYAGAIRYPSPWWFRGLGNQVALALLVSDPAASRQVLHR